MTLARLSDTDAGSNLRQGFDEAFAVPRAADAHSDAVAQARRIKVADKDAALSQLSADVLCGYALDLEEDEVRTRREGTQPGEGSELFVQALTLSLDQVDICAETRDILERRQDRLLRSNCQVVRNLHPPDDFCQRLRHYGEAGPHSGQASPLTKRPQDDEVIVVLHQVREGLTGELSVSLVDGDDGAGRQEPLQFLARQGVAGRVIRRREERQLRPRQLPLRALDVEREVFAPLDVHDVGVVYVAKEAVDAKRGWKVHQGVAGREEEAGAEIQHLIGAVAEYDLLPLDAGVARDRLPNRPLLGVWIILVAVERCQGRVHLRRWAVRVLVGVQLDDLFRRDAELLRHNLGRLERRVCVDRREVLTDEAESAIDREVAAHRRVSFVKRASIDSAWPVRPSARAMAAAAGPIPSTVFCRRPTTLVTLRKSWTPIGEA